MGLHSEAALPPVPPEPDAISRRRAALRWMLRHPRASSYGTALVLLGFFTAVVVSSSARWEPSTKGLPPNQAGYLWCCGATEVAATWEVPQMLPVRAQSAEGVWIGLQTNSGNFFLQVGTQDNQTDFSPTYEGFWSNGPLHGAPENLGTVSPGDVVRAELLLSGGSKWAITFADETQHWSRTRVISYSARYSHAFAEWIEEDPAEVIPFQKAQLFMMAKTDGTHMSSLEVNGGVPGPFELQPESFIDGSDTTFAPSPLEHDSFRFIPW